MKWFSRGLPVGILIAVLLLAGCEPQPPYAPRAAPPPTPSITVEEIVHLNDRWRVYVIHDPRRAVTCYLDSSDGIFCLPDSALAKPSPESAPTK